MKFYFLIIYILIVFFETGNVLSKESIFNVNNIELKKTKNINNDELANKAINKGFNKLLKKILLEEDIKKMSNLNLTQVKELVSYYQIIKQKEENKNTISFNVSFDKEKLHNLFYDTGISYSEIINKELYLLPVFKKGKQIHIYNNNYFYDNWNKIYENELIEFILPLENIEIIQNINSNRDNLSQIKLKEIFSEYVGKNLALIFIEEKSQNIVKIFYKIKISGKNFVRNISFKKTDFEKNELNNDIIIYIKNDLIDVIKSKNLIDIRIPTFLNARFDLNKRNSLVELKYRLNKIDLVEKIYIQEFNNKAVFLKIKYLGKLEKIIKQLEEQKIFLRLVGDQWSLKII